jgi:aryl-alcohol dehydrogenase-like predicted oxidoreductase
MNFGNALKHLMGECTKEMVFEILDYFYSQGGNFIDTANLYQLGESETWIGEWMQSRGRRDEIVLATKYGSGFRLAEGQKILQSNFGGTGSKSMRLSVEASLKKLQTEYIDLLYVHLWDFHTGIPEMMQSLNQLVLAGKVLYLGISDTPAWVVVKANCYARQHGLRPFSVYQGRWSAAKRDFERDILGKDGGRNLPHYGTGRDETVSQVLDKVAKRHNTIITSIALAYVMHKAPYVFPICGGRTVDHLKGNIEALKIRLNDEDIKEIDSGYDFENGFPHDMLGGSNFPYGAKDVPFTKRNGQFDYVEGIKAIEPAQER